MSGASGTVAAEGDLLDFERGWVARYAYLQSRGYTLRPRYHPEWQKSWLQTGRSPNLSEDGVLALPNPKLIDATKEDGTRVCIKRLYHNDNEKKIVMMLDPNTNSPCPQNHSVPVEELLVRDATNSKLRAAPPGDDDHTAYLVMPFLLSINEVPFETVNQVVDLVEQLLEGLVYMHARGVAHRDCSERNIMMDANALYPNGFHPVRPNYLPDMSRKAPRLPRSSAHIRYYYVDYGISSYFDPSSEQDRLVLGIDGIDRDVPELSTKVPYDPFKVDVFMIGNLFKQEVLQKYRNTKFLEPLIHTMIAENPAVRPSASEAYEHWTKLQKQLSSAQRAWRLKPHSEGVATGVFLDAFTAMRLAILLPFKAFTNTVLLRSPREGSSDPSSTASRPSGTHSFPLSAKAMSLFFKRNKPTPSPQEGATASTANANCQSVPSAEHV